MSVIDEGRQVAMLDEADRMADRLRREVSQEVRAAYAALGLDPTALADRVTELVQEGRSAHAAQQAAKRRHELGSGVQLSLVEAVGSWLRQLQAVGRYARVKNHRSGGAVVRLLSCFEAAGPSACIEGMGMALSLDLADLAAFGLPADFRARGVALREQLVTGQEELVHAESVGFVATCCLEARWCSG